MVGASSQANVFYTRRMNASVAHSSTYLEVCVCLSQSSLNNDFPAGSTDTLYTCIGDVHAKVWELPKEGDDEIGPPREIEFNRQHNYQVCANSFGIQHGKTCLVLLRGQPETFQVILVRSSANTTFFYLKCLMVQIDLETGEEKHLDFSTPPTATPCFFDQEHLVWQTTAVDKTTVEVWEWHENPQNIRTMEFENDAGCGPNRWGFQIDGQGDLVHVCDSHSALEAHNIGTARCLHHIDCGHSGDIVAIDVRGSDWVTLAADATIKVWSAATGKCSAQCKVPKEMARFHLGLPYFLRYIDGRIYYNDDSSLYVVTPSRAVI
jgi:WD40 repeat protein